MIYTMKKHGTVETPSFDVDSNFFFEALNLRKRGSKPSRRRLQLLLLAEQERQQAERDADLDRRCGFGG